MFGVSFSKDYLDGAVVIRDFGDPNKRVLAIIPRDNEAEAQQIALQICDLLNKQTPRG